MTSMHDLVNSYHSHKLFWGYGNSLYANTFLGVCMHSIYGYTTVSAIVWKCVFGHSLWPKAHRMTILVSRIVFRVKESDGTIHFSWLDFDVNWFWPDLTLTLTRTNLPWHEPMWPDLIQFNLMWSSLTQGDRRWPYLTWHDLTWPYVTWRPNLIQCDPTWALTWLDPAWPDMTSLTLD